jgi:hypothetical protein
MSTREELIADALALLHEHGLVPTIKEKTASTSKCGGTIAGGVTR